MKPRLLISVGLVVILGAASYGGFAWWRGQQHAAILATVLPEPPDLATQPEALRRRHDAAVTRLRQGPEKVAALDELSRLYHANGFHTEAAQCYAALEQLDPGNGVWWHRHAAIVAGFGDLEPALVLARRAVALAPDYVPARLRLGDLLLKGNRFDDAADVYHAILKRQPEEPYAELGLARCDFEAGRWEAARTRLERLVAQTQYRLGYDLIVTVYERLGQPQRAAAIRGQKMASGAYRDPADPWMDVLIDDCYEPFRLALAAGTLAGAGNIAGSIRLLERAIAASPQNFALHFQLAGVHMSTRAYDKAREQFTLCTTLAPDFPDGWIHLSELLLTLGDRAGADRTLREGLTRCPNSPGMHLIAARRHQQAGRIEEAITEYRIASDLRPNEADARLELARLLIKQNRVPEARAELQAALAAEPEQPETLAILAYDAISEGQEATARQWMRRVLNQPRISRDQRSSLLEAFYNKFGRRFE